MMPNAVAAHTHRLIMPPSLCAEWFETTGPRKVRWEIYRRNDER
jgi:hypothetical protein